jgi:DivIVA domain-containing protein
MDVTPQLIEQIDFVERRHGYDQDEVDEFLERVGATIASLQTQIAELSGRATRAEAEVVALRDQPPAEPRALSDEQDVEQATSTLLLAKRTAEAAISEARQEAAKLLSDARSHADAETTEATAEADRLVRDAHAQREELLKLAREEADAEKVAQRDRLEAEIAALDQRKRAITDDISLVESRLDEYRSGLESVAASIRAVLDDPDSLRVKAPVDLADTPTGSAFYYTGSNPVVSAADSTPLAPGLAESADHPPLDTTGREAQAPDEPEATPSETAPGDPWSPGSWSEVSSALEGDDPLDATLFDDPAGAPRAASAFDEPVQGFAPADQDAEAVRRAHVDTPTESYTDLGSDRFLRDLDQAVNRTDDQDPAMEEFFEGSAGSAPRRFGRRR